MFPGRVSNQRMKLLYVRLCVCVWVLETRRARRRDPNKTGFGMSVTITVDLSEARRRLPPVTSSPGTSVGVHNHTPVWRFVSLSSKWGDVATPKPRRSLFILNSLLLSSTLFPFPPSSFSSLRNTDRFCKKMETISNLTSGYKVVVKVLKLRQKERPLHVTSFW